METTPTPLPAELQQLLRSELRPGEIQVWAAPPLPRLARQQLLAAILIGSAFTGFGLLWTGITQMLAHPNAGQPWWFGLFGIPFLLVGLPFLTSPFWAKNIARNTAYAITNQRAIILTGKLWGGFRVHSYDPARLTSIERTQRRDGSGDLVFEKFVESAGSGTTTVRRGFMAIADVKQVEQILHQTLVAGRTRNMPT